MNFRAEFIDYIKTGYFSKIVTDYLSQKKSLKNFYEHSADLEGIKSAISERKNFNTNRKLLVKELHNQYNSLQTSEKVKENINKLLDEDTFTICTAHQPNIFTGHLYFIYKIIHAIKLADELTEKLPHHFVPVFYMGSEDADLEELGEVTVNGERYQWKTKQTGAVGRMKVDDELLNILKKINGQISVELFGKEIINLVQQCYTKGTTIQEACFKLVNELFKEFGLIVLLPDNSELKRMMVSIFEDDILNNTSSEIVNKTSEQLAEFYQAQAHPREINLFYLKDNLRERIVRNSEFRIQNSELGFDEAELKEELKNHPDRFSPNVILRPLYQETILPNVVFIGGGGEIAYWLQLRDLFKHYQTPFPVLVLRNSFLLINKRINSLIEKLQIKPEELFKNEAELIKKYVEHNSSKQLKLNEENQKLTEYYQQLKNKAGQIDPTLAQHTEALQAKSLKTLQHLEQKLFKAEKKKFDAEQRQIHKIKIELFPGNGLQERVENFIPFYAKLGKEFIKVLYKNSLGLEQQFCILEEE